MNDIGIIIDGNAIMYKTFYGSFAGWDEKEITKEACVFQIKKTLASYLKNKKYKYGIVVFDSTKDTFRKEIFSEYKSKRKSMPKVLFESLEAIKKASEQLGFNVMNAPIPYEADDLIRTLSKIFSDAKIKTEIFSTDKDMLQLVSYYVDLVLLKQKGKKEINNFESFQKLQNGLMPCQIPLLKALCGDKSDNYPGVEGIGEKIAEKLLNTYWNIEKIYENINFLKPAQRKSLLENKEVLDKFLSISTIKDLREQPDVKISLNIQDYEMKFNKI